MGLDTFPLLQNHTCLIMYNNTVFKLKLEYLDMNEHKRVLLQHMSDRAAHCQIEDVCRAVLYSIERKEELSPIQTDNFVIYPELSKWPLEKEVMFVVNGNNLSRHQNLILLKLVCKDVTLSDVDAVQLDISASNSRKSSSNKVSHNISELKTINNCQEKTTSCDPGATSTDKSQRIVSCTSKNPIMLDTPISGIDNIRGGQSPTSDNRITTLIQKHCNLSEISTANVQSNSSGFNTKKFIKNRITTENSESISLSNRSKSTRSEELKKTRKDVYQLVNTKTDMNALVNSSSSENDCSLNTSHNKTNHRRHVYRTRKVVDNIQTNVQSEVQGNDISDGNTQLGLPDSSDAQVQKNTSQLPISGSQSSSNDDELCHSQQLENRGTKTDMCMSTRSSYRKLEGIENNEKEYLIQHPMRNKLRNKEHSIRRKNLKKALDDKIIMASIERSKHDRYKTGKLGNAGESSKLETNTLSAINRKSYVGKVKHIESLEMTDKDVVEISDDGSIIYESERINDIDSIASASPHVAVRHPNEITKKHSSTEYSVSGCNQLQKSDSSSLSESDDANDGLSQQQSIMEDESISSCSTLTRSKTKHRNVSAICRVENNVGSPIVKERRIKVGKDFGRYSSNVKRNRGSLFVNRTSRIIKNQKGQSSESNTHHKITNFNDSDLRKTSERRRKRAVSDTLQVVSHSHRSAEEYSTCEESEIKDSNNQAINYRKRKADEKAKKKVASDSEMESVQTIRSKKNMNSPDSIKRISRSVSGSPSETEVKLFPRGNGRSDNTFLSQSKELRSSKTGHVQTSLKAERKLLKAQQLLQKSKDGVWLF